MTCTAELLFNFTKLFFPNKDIENLDDEDADILLVNEIYDFVRNYPDQFVDKSMFVLVDIFAYNGNPITNIPSIISSVVFINTMNILGLGATYDSYVMKYRSTSDDTNNISYRVIPEISIGGRKMNIYGLMPPIRYWVGKWSNVMEDISAKNRQLHSMGITAGHTISCPLKTLNSEMKFDLLMCSRLDGCTCKVKRYQELVMEYCLSKSLLTLDASIKGIYTGDSRDFSVLKRRFLFEGNPRTTEQLVYIFASRLLEELKKLLVIS